MNTVSEITKPQLAEILNCPYVDQAQLRTGLNQIYSDLTNSDLMQNKDIGKWAIDNFEAVKGHDTFESCIYWADSTPDKRVLKSFGIIL
jgi:hypothetical protein